MEEFTLTSHNKRGVKSTHHQDRTNTGNANHINHALSKYNIYWQWNTGQIKEPDFEECEKEFYKQRYGEQVEKQNERNIKNGHAERNRTTEDIRKGKYTAPMETYFQIGNKDKQTSPDVLLKIMAKLQRRLNKYNKNFHFLDIAMHVDETTTHIAYRTIIDYSKNGIITVGQDKGLEEMGFDLPYPEMKKGQKNNRRMTFDKFIRETLIEICKEFDIEIIKVGDGHVHQEKEDFILEQEIKKKKQQIEELDNGIIAREEKIKDLNTKGKNEVDYVNNLKDKAEKYEKYFNKYDNAMLPIVEENAKKEFRKLQRELEEERTF